MIRNQLVNFIKNLEHIKVTLYKIIDPFYYKIKIKYDANNDAYYTKYIGCKRWCDKNIGYENYKINFLNREKYNKRTNTWEFDVVFSFKTEEELVFFRLANDF